MIKSNYFVFLIIICILLSISVASASDGEATLTADNNYQIKDESNQDVVHDTILKSCDEELIQNSDSDNLNTDSNGESANFTQFHDDLINSGSTFNLNRSYVYENDDVLSGEFEINNLVINGNNNIIDGANSDFIFIFSPKVDEGAGDDDFLKAHCNIVINDLTFVNFNDSIFKFERGDFTLNNVNFTNCHGMDDSLITTEKSINLTFNNCNFYSDSVYGYVVAEKSRIMIYNSNFLSYCRNSAIELNRGQLFVENSTFENCNAQHGSIINFKGDYFKIRNSKFKNSKANSTGGAIIAKYFPLQEGDSGVFFHSEDMIIDNCTFFNISSSSNGGVIHIDLDSASRHIHQSLNVSDCNFTDCSSKFGGAISVLGGFKEMSVL